MLRPFGLVLVGVVLSVGTTAPLRGQDYDLRFAAVGAGLAEPSDSTAGYRVAIWNYRPARTDEDGRFWYRVGYGIDVTHASYGLSAVVGPYLLLLDGRFRPYVRAAGGVGGLFRDATWLTSGGGGIRADLIMPGEDIVAHEMALALYFGLDYVWHGRTRYLDSLAGGKTSFPTAELGITLGFPGRGWEGR